MRLTRRQYTMEMSSSLYRRSTRGLTIRTFMRGSLSCSTVYGSSMTANTSLRIR
jgi:hypothetical protein